MADPVRAAYTFAPWRAEDLAALAEVFRRGRARLRRGTTTKAARRARRRYYCAVLAPSDPRPSRVSQGGAAGPG